MKKIVIIGPESTGKSTLCAQLAAHYKTVWCPEAARKYLLQHGTDYTFEDLHQIAKNQLALEEEIQQKATNNFYFIDTDLYVIKVWYEEVFNDCPTWLLKRLAVRQYDLYLLCNTDLPWVQDGLREYPDVRKREVLFKTYKDLLMNSGTKWSIVSGSGEERLAAATRLIDEAFNNESIK